jgi:hypothetical protein
MTSSTYFKVFVEFTVLCVFIAASIILCALVP